MPARLHAAAGEAGGFTAVQKVLMRRPVSGLSSDG